MFSDSVLRCADRSNAHFLGVAGCDTDHVLRDIAATRSQLTRLAGLPVEAAEFSHEVNALLERTLPFDGWCLVGMAPDTGLRTAQFSGRGTEQTAEMARNEVLMPDVNKYRELAVAVVPAGWLSREHPAAAHSFRLNEILVPQGFHSEVRLVLRDQRRLWGALVLFRESAQRPFDDDDVTVLCALGDALTSAVRAYPVRALGRHGTAPGAGVVALTPDNRLAAVTAEAQLWLDDLVPGGDDETHAEDVTRVLFDAAHAVRHPGAGRAATCVRTVSGHWLRVEGTTGLDGSSRRRRGAAPSHRTRAAGDLRNPPRSGPSRARDSEVAHRRPGQQADRPRAGHIAADRQWPPAFAVPEVRCVRSGGTLRSPRLTESRIRRSRGVRDSCDASR